MINCKVSWSQWSKLLGLISVSCLIASQAVAESNFRGITVNDTPEAIERTVSGQGGSIKWKNAFIPTDEIERNANIFFGKDFCGDVSFSSANKISRMRFI